MVRLKSLTMKNLKDAPQEVVKEVFKCNTELAEAMMPIVAEYSPVVILSALNRIHAAFVVQLVSNNKQEIEKAILIECKSLLENIKVMFEQQEAGDE